MDQITKPSVDRLNNDVSPVEHVNNYFKKFEISTGGISIVETLRFPIDSETSLAPPREILGEILVRFEEILKEDPSPHKPEPRQPASLAAEYRWDGMGWDILSGMTSPPI